MSTYHAREHAATHPASPNRATSTAAAFAAGRRHRRRSRVTVTIALTTAVLALFAVSLMVGHTFYTPGQVTRVILGERVPGASFTVGQLRLPRASLALLAGAAFGLAGVTFQTMLRNALAAPDIVGISSGASVAAVVCIVVLHTSQTTASIAAAVGGLATAVAIAALAAKGGLAGTRLVLIGIGVAAMLRAIVMYVLSKAAVWDVPAAMRWLVGSVNDASWSMVVPLALTTLLLFPVLAATSRSLQLLSLGDDTAAALGVRVRTTRLVAILTSVALMSVGTAAAGPISFVAFLAGPVAARLVRPGGALLLPSALTGALLVLGADLLGQWSLDARYPVGVITGILGAPYLVYLLIRTNHSGGSL